MRLSKPTLILGIFIVISATFMQQLLYFLYDVFGKRQVQVSVGILFVLVALSAIPYLNKINVSNKRKTFFLIILGFGLYLSWQQRIFVERIHSVEYGLLGWFVVRDISKRNINILKLLYGGLIILVFGVLDEALQYLLPYRVGDFRDVIINELGGLWGISLRLILP